MAELVKGTLFFEKTKRKWQIEFFNAKKNKQSTIDCDAARLSSDISKNEDEKIEVEFERDPRYGNPLKVRPAGQDYKPSAVANARPQAQMPQYEAAHQRERGRQQQGFRERERERNRDQRQETESMSNLQFHNPYNFVPAPERKASNELGDKPPNGHDCYHSHLFSGKLRVRLKVETPLLVPDTARVKYEPEDANPNEAHKSFPLRIGMDGRPHLAATSVKGMLRSAYEAITNSRLSVFTKHDERLGFRMEATEGAMMVPVRIEGKSGAEEIVFYTGASELYKDGRPFNRQRQTNQRGEPRNGLLCAAWFPMYTTQRRNKIDSWRIDDHAKRPVDDNARLPKHGERVFAWVEEEDKSPKYKRWRVIKLATTKAALGSAPSGIKEIEGYVCNTGQNIDRKHDEKIFFKDTNNPLPVNNVKLTPSLCKAWDALIKNYRQEHDKGNDVLNEPPTATWRDQNTGRKEEVSLEWSRHIQRTDAEETELDAELKAEKLKVGTLCYARVNQISGSDFEVLELIPVVISRRIHKFAPTELLPEELQPAQKLIELSPADRVFGWVRQPKSKIRKTEFSKAEKEQNAYRGQLRIGAIQCKTPKEEAIKYLNEDADLQGKELGLPLSILGAPKPQQGRFYVAEDKSGKAQPHGRNNEDAGYSREEKGLRGRKVYPHHANLPDDYWKDPNSRELNTSEKDKGFFKEYRRPQDAKGNEQRDKQNRSVQAWVEKETEFEFDIHFINLSDVEFGALLWLLKLNDGKEEPDHFFRLGGGKPLGFGSITLELKGCDVRDGTAWREYYKCLSVGNEPDYRTDKSFLVGTDKTDAEQMVKAYKAAVLEVYPDAVLKTKQDKQPSFEQISFIAAFLRTAKGFETNRPIHYPRAKHYRGQHEPTDEPIHPVKPHADGLAYEWFVENNRNESRRYSLPDLEKDEGLPFFWRRE